MNHVLRFFLLGSPQVLVGDRPLTDFATNKAQALLFYLAVTAPADAARPMPQSRDAIATLLWGEMADTQAKQNLRTVLPNLRQLVGDYLQIGRQTIALDPTTPFWLDVAVLRRDLSPGQSAVDLAARQAAVDLYRGEFLSGFYVSNAPAFEAWVLEQREHIRTLVVEASSSLVSEHIQRADFEAALAASRRLLTLEPWSEQAHRQQMLTLARLGQRSAALAQFEACRAMLATEFSVEPLAETLALYEQIRTGEIGGQRDAGQLAARQVAAPGASARNGQQLVQLVTRDSPVFVNGHKLPHRTELYGRHQELADLQKWIVRDGCRLVGVFGIGGLGKTALATTLVRELAETTRPAKSLTDLTAPATNGGGGRPDRVFHHIIWQSLLNAPPLDEVVREWLFVLSDQTVTSLPASLDQQFDQLLYYLRRQRSLLILDNMESILNGHDGSGHYRPGYEEYGQLIRRLVSDEHRSCLLVTSRERPHDLAHLEEDTPAVRFLSLSGLPIDAGCQMLAARGVDGDAATLADLVQRYSGNPLALKLAAETVDSLFAGDLPAFLQADARIYGDIRDVLDEQFARLSSLERELLIWLAVVREPVSYTVLRDLLAQPPAPRLVLEATRSLQRRSLLETYEEGLGLQNVVLEYTTELLIENMGRALIDCHDETIASGTSHDHPRTLALPDLSTSHMNRFALVLAQAKEYVRASQTRLLLQPVAERLLAQCGVRSAERRLQMLLASLRAAQPAPGYAAANLLHLLLALGADLRGYDFSRLYLRQLYLRGVSLPETNFAQADIIESVFTEPFGLVYTTAFSPDGRYVAAGTSEGAIYLWQTADQQLAQVLQAHSQAIYKLAFAPTNAARGVNELLLASASEDRSVGYWSLADPGQVRWHTRLSHPQQKSLLSAGCSPDGQRVTSVDADGQVFVWDVNVRKDTQPAQRFVTTPTRMGLVAHDAAGQIVAVGQREGAVQVRQVSTGKLELALTVETGPITALALSHDGRMLVTGGREGHLCLWTLPEGQLQQVVETGPAAIDAFAFSPDGKMMASTHGVGDHTIRLWAIDSQARLHLRHTLLGHTHIIWSVAFSPRPASSVAGSRAAARQLLVSGSSDQTVRVWDTETGQALYTRRGQPRALAGVAIHPRPQTLPASAPGAQQEADQAQSWLLAAVGYDRGVHLWSGRGVQADARNRILSGPDQALYAVAISPDGRTVAGAGHGQTVYLWDIESGRLRQRLGDHTTSVECLAFHPHGALLASGSMDGVVRLWDLAKLEGGQGSGVRNSLTAQPTALFQTHPHAIYDIAFSPDGRILATVGGDLSLRLWDMTERHCPKLIEARKPVQAAGDKDLFSVAFSSDGTKLACGGDRLIHLWDFQTAQPKASGESPLVLRGHASWVFSVAFSPDGATLASGSADCTVCLWDVACGVLRATLHGHTETVYKVIFSPDGASVLSCSADGTIRFWDIQTGECVNTLLVDGPYAEMNITGISGVTEAQIAALKALGAVEA